MHRERAALPAPDVGSPFTDHAALFPVRRKQEALEEVTSRASAEGVQMQLKLMLIAIVISVLAGSFGVCRAFDEGSGLERPVATAGRATIASQIQLLEQNVRDNPYDAAALTQLASSYVRRARETGDPSFYALAETAISRARSATPDDAHTLIIAGSLALARHNFEEALTLGEQARLMNPDVVATYGVITDALVELGRYDEAAAAAQEMIDRRPDFASYSRASYLRELNGDIEGAIEAMERATAAGAGLGFDEAWALVIIGNLQLQQGDVAAADRAYERADAAFPGDAMVQAALARIAVQRGDVAGAEALLRLALGQRPLPEYALALGDLLWSQGRDEEAEEQYALVRVTQQLFAANGVDADVELAMFDADHRATPPATYETALAAYGRRPSIFAADTVAWAAYKAGDIDGAERFMDEALRLGTKDARLSYHAGVIAAAAGDAVAAQAHLRDAVALEPAQSLRYRAAARDALQALNSPRRADHFHRMIGDPSAARARTTPEATVG